jgi:hypothetical protein
MSERWVIQWLFKMQSAAVFWEGSELQTDQDPAPLQFRWMLHPCLGLPRQSFVVWHNQHPGGNPTTQELANLPNWEKIETVGLPVDDSWSDTGYDLGDQGLRNNPSPVRPIDAAWDRLQRGAPRIGWTGLALNGLSLPRWASGDPDAWSGPGAREDPVARLSLEGYLREILNGRLMRGLHNMLRDSPDGRDHEKYVDKEVDPGNPARLNPRLLLNQGAAVIGQDQPAHSEWCPLGLLLVAAGTDPLAALTLGFGTALRAGEPDDIYMVSVHHRLRIADLVLDFELADVVTPNRQLQAPEPPSNLSAKIIGHNRPQVLDGPALETVGITWDRPLNPVFAQVPDNSAQAVSYVVGRFDWRRLTGLPPQTWRREILLTRRPNSVGGWLPFVASKPGEARPVLFADHVIRSSTSDHQVVAEPTGLDCTYAVAAQDIFGRWSTWETVAFQGVDEPPQIPSILAVKLEPSGTVVVDFSWDWSDRSPEFVDLIGAYEDDPGNQLFNVHLQFGGSNQPAPGGAQVIPLKPDREPAIDWGAAQDRNPAEPEVRFYRLTTTIPLNFAGKPWRFFQVQTRGQCHIHQVQLFGWNISPFGPPSSTQVYDPAQPQRPAVPEARQWASLRDVAGVSRAVLSWPGDPNVAGYLLYEATETSLLAALVPPLPGPDTSQPFKDRLAVLRAKNLPALQSAFRRVQKELIPPTTPETFYEVALPRGSTVMHFYAITAMSHNQVESLWPDDSKKFIAVAVPRLAVPAAPSLEANLDPQAAPPVVNLRVGIRPGVAVSQVELFRVMSDKLAASADTMGPPIVTLNAAGPEISFVDTRLSPGWRRAWYRAVAWSSRDDLQGLIEARSTASPAVSVLLPPQAPPDVSDLKVNEPGSSSAEALVSWSSKAPVAVTPLGPHIAVLEARNAAGGLIIRLEGRLAALAAVNSLADLPPANPAGRGIVRVGAPGSYRLYAWLPRPAADQAFRITVKMIDPLGRIGTATADVPPLTSGNLVVPNFVGSRVDEANHLAESAHIILEYRFPEHRFPGHFVELRVTNQNFPPGTEIPPTVHVVLTFENVNLPPPE